MIASDAGYALPRGCLGGLAEQQPAAAPLPLLGAQRASGAGRLAHEPCSRQSDAHHTACRIRAFRQFEYLTSPLRLFDTTVRAEYERPLHLAKQQTRTPTPARRALPLADITGGGDWKDTPLLKSRLAGGFCLRAPTQGACTYANICEHCPSFHAAPSSLPVLAAQRVDAEALAADAEKRGWITEAERHHRLITQLDTLISEAQAG